MATKTISLELDAYERLRREKRGRESFSAVVRRARFDHDPSTGAALLAETSAIYAAGKGPRRPVFEYWSSAAEKSGSSPSHW